MKQTIDQRATNAAMLQLHRLRRRDGVSWTGAQATEKVLARLKAAYLAGFRAAARKATPVADPISGAGDKL